MSLFERIEARRNNGEAITSPHTEGLAPMDQTTETEDRGLPLLDPKSTPVLEATDVETSDGPDLEHIDEALAKLMNREDRQRTIRTEAERAEQALKAKTSALEAADAAARAATADRIVAERISPDELRAAKHREDEAIVALSTARNDHAREARAVEALRDRLKVDTSLADVLAEGRAAVDALLEHERSCAASGIVNALRLACSKVVLELATLRDILGGGQITIQGIQLDRDTIQRLLGWAEARDAQSLPQTRRLLDIAAYIRREPGKITDETLRVRAFDFTYEESRGPAAGPPKWRPGEKLVLKCIRPSSVGIRFERSDEEIVFRPGEVRDCTSLGVPTVATRQMIDSDEYFEVIRAA